MAKNAVATDHKPGMIEKLRTFLEEVQTEMKKVTWPTMEDLKLSTKVTMYLLLAMAAIIFVYDQVFQILVFFLLRLDTLFG